MRLPIQLRRTALLLLPILLGAGAFLYLELNENSAGPKQFPRPDGSEAVASEPVPDGGSELATFGSGCYWCAEAVFQQVKGVKKVVSGFSGGHVPNPTYEQVCSGATGHAEVVQLTYDPSIISYAELLEVFWRTHDPTTRDRQGGDRGPQYRSAIFYHNQRQKRLAEQYKSQIDAAGVFSKPIVTEIEPYEQFFPADESHQNYYATHGEQSYCQVVIGPKLEKLRAVFHGKLKTE